MKTAGGRGSSSVPAGHDAPETPTKSHALN